ncbi:MAG: membrane dipeptidase, partial [Clostridia bacterium]|nr:membrane dipeptidase [Clostridia bacterium]
ILRHVDHWLTLGGEHHIAMGGDLDGAPLPDGIHGVSDVTKIADAMVQHGYGDALIRYIFSQNALDFIEKNLGGSSVR